MLFQDRLQEQLLRLQRTSQSDGLGARFVGLQNALGKWDPPLVSLNCGGGFGELLPKDMGEEPTDGLEPAIGCKLSGQQERLETELIRSYGINDDLRDALLEFLRDKQRLRCWR